MAAMAAAKRGRPTETSSAPKNERRTTPARAPPRSGARERDLHARAGAGLGLDRERAAAGRDAVGEQRQAHVPGRVLLAEVLPGHAAAVVLDHERHLAAVVAQFDARRPRRRVAVDVAQRLLYRAVQELGRR